MYIHTLILTFSFFLYIYCG